MTASTQFPVGANVKFPVNGALVDATIESLIDEQDALKKDLGYDCAVKFIDAGAEAFDYAKFSELEAAEAPAEKPARKGRSKKTNEDETDAKKLANDKRMGRGPADGSDLPTQVDMPAPLAELLCPETSVLFKLGDLVEYEIQGKVEQGRILELKDQKPPYTAIALVPHLIAGEREPRRWTKELQSLKHVASVGEATALTTGWWSNGGPAHWIQDGKALCGREMFGKTPVITTADPAAPEYQQNQCKKCVKAMQKAGIGQVEQDNPFPVTEAQLDARIEGFDEHAPDPLEQIDFDQVPAVAVSTSVATEIPGTPVLGTELASSEPLTAEPAPTQPVHDSGITMQPLSKLFPWADQPRREFQQHALDELGESIKHKGLMQNLTGRLAPDGRIEIVIGGRRLRAMNGLVKAGDWQPDHLVAVAIRDLNDLDALMLATAENVERQDMTPLEEADAFTRMVELGAAPEDIALKFGHSLKTVQQRLTLARGLGDDGRKLYQAGKIGLGQAQVIAQTSGPIRKHVVKAAAEGGYGGTAQALHNLIKRSSFLVEHAKFNVEKSGLEIVHDLYGDQPDRFVDPKAALALQLDWVKDRAAKLEKKKEHHFVDILKHEGSSFLPHDKYESYNVPVSVRGTVILVSITTGQVEERRCARRADMKSARAKEQAAERKQASNEASGSEGAAIRKQGWIDGHEARATALRSALVGDHKRAVALTILMILEASPVELRASLSHTQAVEIPAGIARLKELDSKLGGKLQVNHHHQPQRPLSVKFGYGMEAARPAREYLELLLTLHLDELLDIQSVLIAQAVGGWSAYNPVHAPYDFGVKLAADTGAVVKFRLTDEHLKAYPRDRLLELAQDAGLDYIVANASKYPTSTALRGAVLEMADELEQRGYVPPIARFPASATTD